MNILAHRGIWKSIIDKNNIQSLKKAIEINLGIETDIRDYKGKLVISHNIADENCTLVSELFEVYQNMQSSVQLALNVKADGIQDLLIDLLDKYEIDNYFLFDMSIPELVVNEKKGLKFYTRHSDIESECVLYDKACGVWLDSFYDENWLTPEIIDRHLADGKSMCIISPEIHGFDNTNYWNMLKDNNYHKSDLISLCTDLPDKAREFFS